MQTTLVAAAALTFAIGAIHSTLGEVLIFRRLRERRPAPARAATDDAPALRERHHGILWATWHVVTVFGWAFAAILLALADAHDTATTTASLRAAVTTTTAAAMSAAAVLVLIGTKGRHPAWLGLFGVAALVFFF